MMIRKLSVALASFLMVSGASRSSAAILVELSGTPSSSTVNYSFSGSGTWQITANRNAGLHFNSNNSLSNFVDSNFSTSVDVPLSGTITNTTTGAGIAIVGLRLTDSFNGDDWSFLLGSGTLSGVLGDNYVVTGSGSFSLTALTFGNFILGSNVSNVGTGTSDFGPATLTVVPESAAFGLVSGVCALGWIGARRRRLTQG